MGLADQVRLRRGKVSVWAGITHHGKTQMLKQVCLSLVAAGERVCIASLEELPEETFADMARQALGYRQAQQTEDFIKAIAEDAQNSKLRERMPERYRALIDHYTQDGPVQQVLIPAERFVEYFQTAGIDPAQAAADVGATNFAEAVTAGSDVVIPMQAFVANVAASDHLQGLVQDIRLAPDEMTPREAAEADKNAAEIEKRVQEEVGKIDEAAKASAELDAAIQRIVADAETQLATRYDAATARQLATVMRGVAVLAQRANPNADPLEAAQALWDKYGLNIDALAGFDEAMPADSAVFDQALANAMPKGWTMGDGKTVAALWRGETDAVAVLLGQTVGKLAQEVPWTSGYSHSVRKAALNHIRRSHGDAATEARRGQIAVTDADLAAVASIPADYDAMRSDLFSRRGLPVITYVKRVEDGILLYMEEVHKKRRDMSALSLWKYPAGGDAQQILKSAVSDPNVRNGGGHERNLDPPAPNFNQQESGGPKRGSLQIGPDRRMRISLFEKANLSTFLHETGHFYLEVIGDLAEAEGSDPQVKDDYAHILKWLAGLEAYTAFAGDTPVAVAGLMELWPGRALAWLPRRSSR